MSVYTTAEVRALLAAATSAAASQAAWARGQGISAGYVCDVLRGRKEPGPKILKALGLQAAYVAKGESNHG
jgi:hypothetical protein